MMHYLILLYYVSFIFRSSKFSARLSYSPRKERALKIYTDDSPQPAKSLSVNNLSSGATEFGPSPKISMTTGGHLADDLDWYVSSNQRPISWCNCPLCHACLRGRATNWNKVCTYPNICSSICTCPNSLQRSACLDKSFLCPAVWQSHLDPLFSTKWSFWQQS